MRDGEEIGIHGGIGRAVSGDDDGINELDGETGGDDGVGCMGQVICIHPYAPSIFSKNNSNYFDSLDVSKKERVGE